MGHNEKDKRPNATIIIQTTNGIINHSNFCRPISSNGRISELDGCTLSKDNTHYSTYNGATLDGVSLTTLYLNESTMDINGLRKELTGFMNKYNKDYKIATEIDGKEVSYEEFCKAIDKSEMLLHAKGLTGNGTVVSQEHHVNSRGHKDHSISTGNMKE